MKNVLVGFFQVEGHGADCVETPIIGNPKEEHARLVNLIRRKHPKSKSITRTGTSIENRDGENAAGHIQLTPGQTLGGLFGSTETLRTVGSVWFSGAPYSIVLAYYRAQSCIGVVLRARLAKDGDIRLDNRINPQRLASELPQILDEVLDREAREIKLNIREANPNF